MNRINELFSKAGNRKLLSLYFCAGCPAPDNTADTLRAMQRRGIDMVEVGIPFSDPMADGPAIQDAATKALRNGMTLAKLFGQLKAIKDEITMPVILMGYLNPILQYGIGRFCESCAECGVDGAIIPDLPFKDYMETVKPVADRHNIRIIMLITPETSDERIRFIDDHTDGFIYMVSSAATTGAQQLFDDKRLEYFRRIILAILGVACQMIPYFCVVNVISKMFAGETAFSAYLPVCLVALTGYCGKVLFSNLSTVISHNAAYSTLRDLRERVVEKLAKVPMGTILDTPSGHYKSIIVDRIEGMEVPFAHLLPEMTSNMLVPLFIIMYLFVLDWRMALLSLATLFIGLSLCPSVCGTMPQKAQVQWPPARKWPMLL